MTGIALRDQPTDGRIRVTLRLKRVFQRLDGGGEHRLREGPDLVATARLAEALTCRAALYGLVSGVAPGPRLVKAAAVDPEAVTALVQATDLAPEEGDEGADRFFIGNVISTKRYDDPRLGRIEVGD